MVKGSFLQWQEQRVCFPVAGLHGKVAVGNVGLWMAFQLHCAHVESSRAAERRGGAVHSQALPLVTQNRHPGWGRQQVWKAILPLTVGTGLLSHHS